MIRNGNLSIYETLLIQHSMGCLYQRKQHHTHDIISTAPQAGMKKKWKNKKKNVKMSHDRVK